MSIFARRALLGLLSLCVLAACFAASTAIGLVVANGSFQLDQSSVRGSATLFDGNVIETNVTSSQLQLNNGVSLRLAAETRAMLCSRRSGSGSINAITLRADSSIQWAKSPSRFCSMPIRRVITLIGM